MNNQNKLQKYTELQAKAKKLKTQLDSLKAQIIAEVDDNKTLTLDDYQATLTVYDSERFDTTTFKIEKPNLYTRYLKTIESKRLNVRKVGA